MDDTPIPTPKPCPFCGRTPELDNPDTLYPNGTGWKPFGDMRSYVNFREVPREQWCYGMHCDESCGGCGAEIIGDSAAEAVSKWNRRAAAALVEAEAANPPIGSADSVESKSPPAAALRHTESFEVRVAGPDDLLRFGDELEALRAANKINVEYLEDRFANPDDEVMCIATVHNAAPQAQISGSDVNAASTASTKPTDRASTESPSVSAE